MNLIIGHLHKLHGYELGLTYNILGKREGLVNTLHIHIQKQNLSLSQFKKT